MAVIAQACANHPDRPARALCMQCRKMVCLECATQWDGINYCVNCLKKKREATHERSSFFAWAAMLLLIAILFAAGSLIMVWSSTVTIRMWGS
ncbi:MAG TPA: B-box zinc finger protein [Planctomycetota bacterium]|nr:B-box zinc finger protein [Planctomycetota bacterium]